MRILVLFLALNVVCRAEDVRWFSMQYISRASYAIDQMPFKSIGFGGIQGDIPGKLSQRILQNLSKVSGLEVISPDSKNSQTRSLLRIQGHTSRGLKKLKDLLSVQSLMQGNLELSIGKQLVVQFSLEIYDLDTGVTVYNLSRNWQFKLETKDPELFYDFAVDKIIAEIDTDWFTSTKTEKIPWFYKAHTKASQILDLILKGDFESSLNYLEADKRSLEVTIYRDRDNIEYKKKYQLLLFHYGLLFELSNRFVLARQYYQLALRHGKNFYSNLIEEAQTRLKHRL